jgi:outer membrane protein TolC
VKARTLLVVAALAAAAAAARAQGDEQWIGGNVESLLAFARDRHPEFAAMRHEAAAAADRVESAGNLPDPMFRAELRDFTNEGNPAASPNLLPTRVGSTKYTVIQTLPWFGKRDLRRDAAAAGASEAEQRARATWMELATRIKQTYALHHVHLATLRLLRDNLVTLRQIEEVAQARYASGLGSQQDAIRAQTERALLQSDLAMLEGESAQASARMRSLLGGPPASVRLRPPERLRPLPPAARLDFAALEARLLANNPQLGADAARIAAADKGRELAYRNRYPDVSLGVSPIQTNTRVSEWELMFEVNIPLQQGSRRAQEREAERMLEAARARREATQNQALAELAEALAGLEAARRVESVSGVSLMPQAEVALQSALAGYETGKVEFAAVLDAQRQIRRAQQDRIKARGDQQARLAEIERLIGEEL